MMTEAEVEDAVWRRVHELTPPCDCGGAQSPGGVSGRHVLVCSSCSTVSDVESSVIEGLVAQARSDVESRNLEFPNCSALLPAVSAMRQTGTLHGTHIPEVSADRDVGAELIKLVRRMEELGWDGGVLAADFLEQVVTGKVPPRRLMMADIECPACRRPLSIDKARVVVTDSELQVSETVVLVARNRPRT